MNTLHNLNIKTDLFEIHTWGNSEFFNAENAITDLYSLLSNQINLKYCKELELETIDTARRFARQLSRAIREEEIHCYFISERKSNKLIGEIILAPPTLVMKEYAKGNPSLTFENTWFIQYIIDEKMWGKGVMSTIIPTVLNSINKTIKNVGALCHQDNTASKKILKKNGFELMHWNDQVQDYYFKKL